MFKKRGEKKKNKLRKFNLKKIGPKIKRVFKKSTDSLFYIGLLLILLTDMYIISEAWDTEDSDLEILGWIKGFTTIMILLGIIIGWDDL